MALQKSSERCPAVPTVDRSIDTHFLNVTGKAQVNSTRNCVSLKSSVRAWKISHGIFNIQLFPCIRLDGNLPSIDMISQFLRKNYL